MLAGAFRAGELPLWDWLTHGGQPFLADPQSTVFYPSRVLYAVLPPLVAFNVSIILQFLLCAFGAYWLCRVLQLAPVSAFVGGVIFTFCGYALSTANLLLPLFGLPWLPLLLGCAERWFESRRVRWIVLAVLSAAMPLFGGAPEIAVMSWATALAWVWRARQPLRSRARFLFVVLAFTAGITLIQVLPTLEVIRESSRARPMTFAHFAAWSVSPRRLPELAVPQFFGRTDSLDERQYWGRAAEDEGFPYILSLYFGIPSLLLAAYGATDRSRSRQALVLAALASLAILLALGRHLPLLSLVFRIPGVALFRYPVKAMALAVLPVALLAATGVERLRMAAIRGWIHYATWAAVALTAFVSILLFTSEPFRGSFLRAFFRDADPAAAAPLAAAFARVAALAAAFGIALLLRRSEKMLAALLAGLVTIDLVAAGWPVNDYAPRTFFDESSSVATVRRAVDGGRLYRTPNPAEFALNAPSDDIVWFSRWNLQVLSQYTAILYGLPVIFHKDYDGLAPRREVELAGSVQKLPWRGKIPILAKAGCRAVMTADLIRNPAAHPLAVVTNASNHPFYLYGIDGGGLAWFTSRIASANPRDELRQVIGSSDMTIVDAEATTAACGDAPARVVRQTWSALELGIDAPCDGYVVIATTFYPGWRAYVDGVDRPLVRANYAFSAVRVNGGSHAVRLEYRPASVMFGAVGTAVSLMLLAAYAWFFRNRP